METENISEYHIEKNTDQDSALNFEFLRARGLALVQQYAGAAWTDYNLHDPGITILEHLCYAITDLAYRTSFDIGDLLTEKDGTIDYAKNLFFSKHDILTTNPVLINDFRKLVIDKVPEVYNVWIDPVLSAVSRDFIKGLYKVSIQVTNDDIQDNFENKTEEEKQQYKDEISAKVQKVLSAVRNVGEDYESFSVLEPCDVYVEAEIVTDRHKMQEEILAQVYDVLIKTLNPPINFYTEGSLLQQGKSIEEIYEGPALEHGFIVEEEMTEKVRIVDPSDLTQAVIAIEGVEYVRKLVVTIDGVEYDHKPFYIAAGKFPRFVFNPDEPTIRLYNGSYEIGLKKSIFSSLLHKKLDANKRKYIKGYHDNIDTTDKREYRNIDAYQSIEDLFPPAYRLNIDEIESPQKARREQDQSFRTNQAKAKQLKAYLMFFEQVLANYLSQLANIGGILSTDLDISRTNRTYFSQPLYSVPGAGNILADFMGPTSHPTEADWERFKGDANNPYRQFLASHVESDDMFTERKKRLLDHMLSRFNINLLKFPLQLFDKLYKLPGADERDEKHAELFWKADLLRGIVDLTRNRNQAVNYIGTYASDAGGFENLMANLLYLKNGNRKRLGEAFEKALGGERFRVERNTPGQTADKKLETYEVNWDGERLDMLISEEEKDKLLGPAEEQTPVTTDDGIIRIHQAGISFLRDGIELRNYKMGPEINSRGFVLLYRSPKDRQWSRVGKYENRDEAVKALNDFTDFLKGISIKTEGFHLVEHVLLRPSLEEKSFGFTFHDDKGNVLLKNNKWFSFAEREKMLRDILTLAAGEFTHEELIGTLDNVALVNMNTDPAYPNFVSARATLSGHAPQSENFIKKLVHCLRSSQDQSAIVYPCFKNIVKRMNGTEVEEDFFRFRMSVVLPAWPARFQDKAFRQFTENLFIENGPAHMRFDFKWLPFGSINQFEGFFFSWTEALKAGRLTEESRTEADQLIGFLSA